MAQSRNGAEILKTAIVRKLLDDFQHNRVPGIDSTPLIIQSRPQPFTPEPYIYIYEVTSSEVDITKDSSSRQYNIRAQVVTKSDINRSAERVRDAMVDEITRSIDEQTSGYIDITADGYNVYIQNVGEVTKFVDDTTRGATYFIANVEMFFTADFIGAPVVNQPNQANVFTFNGFLRPIRNNSIEMFDSGAIVPATTYPGNNNGWDFVSTSASVTSGAQGRINAGSYTVQSNDDPLGLDIVINYEFSTDTSQTTSLNQTTNFPRRIDVRHGVINPGAGQQPTFTDDSNTTSGIRNLGSFDNGTDRLFNAFTNPIGQTVTFRRRVDDFMYIVTGANAPEINVIRENVFNQDIRDQFRLVSVGAYRVYFSNTAANVDGDITVTLL